MVRGQALIDDQDRPEGHGHDQPRQSEDPECATKGGQRGAVPLEPWGLGLASGHTRTWWWPTRLPLDRRWARGPFDFCARLLADGGLDLLTGGIRHRRCAVVGGRTGHPDNPNPRGVAN